MIAKGVRSMHTLCFVEQIVLHSSNACLRVYLILRAVLAQHIAILHLKEIRITCNPDIGNVSAVTDLNNTFPVFGAHPIPEKDLCNGKERNIIVCFLCSSHRKQQSPLILVGPIYAFPQSSMEINIPKVFLRWWPVFISNNSLGNIWPCFAIYHRK